MFYTILFPRSPIAAVVAKNKDLLLDILQGDNYRQLKASKNKENKCQKKNDAFNSNQEKICHNKTQSSTGESVEVVSAKKHEDYKAEQMLLNQALMAAITTSQPDLLEVLLQAGADIHCWDEWCPISNTVVDSGNLEVFTVMKNYISGIEVDSYYGNLLHSAVRSKRFLMVKEVFDMGFTECSQSITDGATPLHVAVRNIPFICPELLKLIKSGEIDEWTYNSKSQNSEEKSHNCDGTQQYDFRIIEFLLEKGISVNLKDSKSSTVLHEAARFGSEELVDILLRAGGDKHAVDEKGNLPWFNFASWGHSNLLDKLFDRDEAEKQFHLHKLAKCGNLKGLQYILTQGVDVLSENQDGDTPLFVAVKHCNFDCISELLNHSPNGLDGINSIDPFQRMLTYFSSSKKTSLLELFLERGQNINAVCRCHCKTPLLDHIYSPQIVRWLLEHGADPSFVTPDGEFALMHLCEQEELEQIEDILRLLLYNNVDISQTQLLNSEGLTALQVALCCHHGYDFIKLCVAAGFSLYNIQDWIEEEEESTVEELISYDNQFDSLFEYIKEKEFAPISLKGLSRLSVLKCLGNLDVAEKIKGLGLPNMLEDFLDWEKYLELRCEELDKCFESIKTD